MIKLEPIFYKIVRPILKLFISLYKPTYININYIQYGKGKDILLLHGWGIILVT